LGAHPERRCVRGDTDAAAVRKMFVLDERTIWMVDMTLASDVDELIFEFWRRLGF
jgi:hypothetical protein